MEPLRLRFIVLAQNLSESRMKPASAYAFRSFTSMQFSCHPHRSMPMCVCATQMSHAGAIQRQKKIGAPAKAWQISSTLNDIHFISVCSPPHILSIFMLFGTARDTMQQLNKTTARTSEYASVNVSTKTKKRHAKCREPWKWRYTLALIDDQHNVHSTYYIFRHLGHTHCDYVTGLYALQFLLKYFRCLIFYFSFVVSTPRFSPVFFSIVYRARVHYFVAVASSQFNVVFTFEVARTAVGRLNGRPFP